MNITSIYFCSWGRCGLASFTDRYLVVPDWGGEVERDFGSGRDLIWSLLGDVSCNISLNSLAIVSSFLETTNTEWIYKNDIKVNT